jgi:hypothetical protein
MRADLGVFGIGGARRGRAALGIGAREVDRAREVVEHLIGKVRDQFVGIGDHAVDHALPHAPFEQAIDRQGSDIGDELLLFGGQCRAGADLGAIVSILSRARTSAPRPAPSPSSRRRSLEC